jgi:hypothetical protein
MISTKYFDHRGEEVRATLASHPATPAARAKTGPGAANGYLLSFWRKTGYLCRCPA